MDRKTRYAFLAAAAVLGAVALAQTQPMPQGGGMQGPQGAASGMQQQHMRRGPPSEALAACASLASGAACSFTSPRGKESGSCWAPQNGMPLACRPAGMGAGPGGPRQGGGMQGGMQGGGGMQQGGMPPQR